MKALIVIVIIAACAFVGFKLTQQWEAAKESENTNKKPVIVASETLPGMDGSLEGPYSEAKRRGATGLRDFLTRYGKTIKDPRLGAIELDYASLLVKDNPVEARKIFARVKQRTPESSPNYPRIKQLQNMYE